MRHGGQLMQQTLENETQHLIVGRNILQFVCSGDKMLTIIVSLNHNLYAKLLGFRVILQFWEKFFWVQLWFCHAAQLKPDFVTINQVPFLWGLTTPRTSPSSALSGNLSKPPTNMTCSTRCSIIHSHYEWEKARVQLEQWSLRFPLSYIKCSPDTNIGQSLIIPIIVFQTQSESGN